MALYRDQLGREISLKRAPQRIVSLVPSLSELVVDLVGSERLVGVTSWCEHPVHLRKEKTVIGGTKNVDIEKVRQLKPDLILANKEENLPEQIEALSEFCPVWVSDVRSIEQALDLFLQIGDLVQSKTGDLLHAQAQDIINSLNTEPQKTVLYFIWKEPYMVAGRDTYINALLTLSGLKNIAPENEERYPSLSLEEIKTLNPQLVLLCSEPYNFTAGDTLDFWPQARVKVIDGALFTWYGSRLLKVLRYLKMSPFKN